MEEEAVVPYLLILEIVAGGVLMLFTLERPNKTSGIEFIIKIAKNIDMFNVFTAAHSNSGISVMSVGDPSPLGEERERY